jgi:hypothetical protein
MSRDTVGIIKKVVGKNEEKVGKSIKNQKPGVFSAGQQSF